MRDRSWRRMHKKRIKEKFKKILRTVWKWDDEEKIEINSSIMANHGKMCSCPMCGNERNHFGKKTKKEIQNELAFKEQTKIDDETITGIICPVWGGGCTTPELCKDKCFDIDLLEKPSKDHLNAKEHAKEAELLLSLIEDEDEK